MHYLNNVQINRIFIMINNVEVIKPHLTFLNDRSFYFVQILKRKKENPEQKSYSIPIESFYIYSIEQLDRMMPRIIDICEKNRARAYIKMNCLDAQSVALGMITELTQIIRKGDWKVMSAALNSSCGRCGKQDGLNKLYLFDLDGPYKDKADEISMFIDTLPPIMPGKSKVICTIPTKNGCHLITKGFDIKEFRKVYTKEMVDIHEDGNTILYFPDSVGKYHNITTDDLKRLKPSDVVYLPFSEFPKQVIVQINDNRIISTPDSSYNVFNSIYDNHYSDIQIKY